jgi:hypothetical protein
MRVAVGQALVQEQTSDGEMGKMRALSQGTARRMRNMRAA